MDPKSPNERSRDLMDHTVWLRCNWKIGHDTVNMCRIISYSPDP